jgi:hypothetical protein
MAERRLQARAARRVTPRQPVAHIVREAAAGVPEKVMTDATRDQHPVDTPGGGAEDRGIAGDGGEDVTGTQEPAGPISDRLGRNPANLGDEVEGRGDITYPTPDPDGPQI